MNKQTTTPSSSLCLLKPKRPLTAYHLFLQLEREYIIQSEIEGDVPIDNDKVYLEDAPQRYKNIRISQDWYEKSGKRAKRKHRKSHGKIGFLELSRIIAVRWKQLSTTDQETLQFVQKIAKCELKKYFDEMNEYKKVTKDIELQAEIAQSPVDSPIILENCNINSQLVHPTSSYTYPPAPATTGLENDVNLPKHNRAEPSQYEFDNQAPKKRKLLHQRTISISGISDIDLEVDMGDDDILSLWKSVNPGQAF